MENNESKGISYSYHCSAQGCLQVKATQAIYNSSNLYKHIRMVLKPRTGNPLGNRPPYNEKRKNGDCPN